MSKKVMLQLQYDDNDVYGAMRVVKDPLAHFDALTALDVIGDWQSQVDALYAKAHKKYKKWFHERSGQPCPQFSDPEMIDRRLFNRDHLFAIRLCQYVEQHQEDTSQLAMAVREFASSQYQASVNLNNGLYLGLEKLAEILPLESDVKVEA